MMLGLVLARAGVDVTVMEKHADFLRDFRGDTVHASTLRNLDELGLGPAFADVPHRLIDTISMSVQDTPPVDIDLRHLPGRHQHIALVPQWDFLELLAAAPSGSRRSGCCAAPKCWVRCGPVVRWSGGCATATPTANTRCAPI